MKVRKNISQKEAACPHCGTLPSNEFLDLVQELRDEMGIPLYFTSMHRCKAYNKSIKGFYRSVHMVKIRGEAYGGVDIRTGRYNNTFRWKLLRIALRLGFNNLEFANRHSHLGRVGEDHPGYNKVIWGTSK